jgi:hypothetical protein
MSLSRPRTCNKGVTHIRNRRFWNGSLVGQGKRILTLTCALTLGCLVSWLFPLFFEVGMSSLNYDLWIVGFKTSWNLRLGLKLSASISTRRKNKKTNLEIIASSLRLGTCQGRPMLFYRGPSNTLSKTVVSDVCDYTWKVGVQFIMCMEFLEWEQHTPTRWGARDFHMYLDRYIKDVGSYLPTQSWV